MRKLVSFDTLWAADWPSASYFAPYFLDARRRATFFASGHDGGAFSVEGLEGTTGLTPKTGLVSARLFFFANEDHGVLLGYSKWDGRQGKKYSYYSKGDLRKLGEYVWSFERTRLSVGLFISFEQGWSGIQDFMETEGQLPSSIEWIAESDIPSYAFPPP